MQARRVLEAGVRNANEERRKAHCRGRVEHRPGFPPAPEARGSAPRMAVGRPRGSAPTNAEAKSGWQD
eukprot:98005-Lingulodinium_polyedra.AAC.1